MRRFPSNTASDAGIRQRVAVIVMAVCAAGCAVLAGCDGPSKPSSDTQAGSHLPASATARERAEFDGLLAEWRGVVGRLAKLDIQYRLLGTRDHPEIRRHFEQQLSRGEELQPRLIEAAFVAYAKRPEDNKDLINFLGSVAAMEAAREEYEIAARILQRLIDNGVESQGLYELAISTAFKANDFELAEKYLALEKKKKLHFGTINSQGFRGQIEYYREAWGKEKQRRDAESLADDLPRVKIRTNKGEIELELFENEAPNTVANFIALVEKGFYDGLTFHRVTAGETAQAGCPVGDGTGGPGYRIRSECRNPKRRCHFRGSLSMVTTAPGTSGSQFSLCLVPARQMDGQHTVFGRVVRGMEVLSKLQRRVPRDPMSVAMNPHANVMIPPADRILSATVVRKRPHPYKPEVLVDTPPPTTATHPTPQ